MLSIERPTQALDRRIISAQSAYDVCSLSLTFALLTFAVAQRSRVAEAIAPTDRGIFRIECESPGFPLGRALR